MPMYKQPPAPVIRPSMYRQRLLIWGGERGLNPKIESNHHKMLRPAKDRHNFFKARKGPPKKKLRPAKVHGPY